MNNKELTDEIHQLKRENNAIILAHNYQLPEIQEIADFTGDSLELSRKAADTQADIIVFCGVHFMAETAAIISPDKTVLLPSLQAGCPLADMITSNQLKNFKEQIKRNDRKISVVAYVNTSVEIKAEVDYCCTSANAIDIVNSIPKEDIIIFIPDKNLGEYVMEQTKRELILWPGYCPTHQNITTEDIAFQKSKHPNAIVLAHPECQSQIRNSADAVLSTSGMCKFAGQSSQNEFIIATEISLLHRLKNENPQKQFYPASQSAVCPNMKKISLEILADSLRNMQYEIQISSEIARKARYAIEKMTNI